MNNWTDWEVIRHQVALCGRVLDERGAPVEGAGVTITEMPKDWQIAVEDAKQFVGGKWEQCEERPDRTLTDRDGIFYFLDLPRGEYTVYGTERRSGSVAQASAKVSWSKDETVEMAVVDLKLVSP